MPILTNIGPNGATTPGADVVVKYQGRDYHAKLSNLHWDYTANTLVATAYSNVSWWIFYGTVSSSVKYDIPYTNVGQLYWSNSYNTLVSSNGTQTSIWFGNIWPPVTSATNGKVTGTNLAVVDAMKLLHQIYYSQDAYTILTFNGDMNDANRIRDITATMTAQTDQLNKTVAALQSSEGRSDFYTVYFNSMPKYTYTPFTTPGFRQQRC
ncbi:hypothetical protein H7R52_03170 [Weissella confusa]|uniref:Uncharacterized protein n=1 Tax=Weissella confusa TaxID=1583 RepID=A0A923NGF8_WEICO|nr:hypothetical protein [Weissella confusa]